MGRHKMNQNDKNHLSGDFKRLKKEKKKWKEEKLLKVRNVSPNCSEKETENKESYLSTFSIAVPGSILDNAQSPELRTYLAGQIGRAACVFKVDEVRLRQEYVYLHGKCARVTYEFK
jgi:hypothetical protein